MSAKDEPQPLTGGRANFGLLVGEDGPVYVASPEEWAEVQRAAGLGPRATGSDVVAAIESLRGEP